MKKKGIALISALIIAAFMVALTGAFMTVNQSHFAILRNSEDQTRAQRAAQAGIEYAFYNLEHERRWGTTNVSEIPSRNSSTPSLGRDDFKIVSVNGNTLEARYEPLDADLTITVVNNLNTAPMTQSQIDDALSLGNVPNEHAKIQVTAHAGGGLHEAEALVRLAPLYEDTLFANGEIDIDAANGLELKSNDPFRNNVRATGDVYLPDVNGGQTRFLRSDGSFDGKGVLQANGKVYDRKPSGTDELLDSDIAKTGGRVMSEVKRRFPFFDLEPKELPVAGVSGQEKVEVASGEFRFTRSRAIADFEQSTTFGTTINTATADIDVLEWYENPGDPYPAKVFRSYRRLYDAGSGTHITDSTLFQYSNGDQISVTDPGFIEAQITGYVALDGGVPKAISESEQGNYKVVINLDDQQFNVAPHTQVVPVAQNGGEAQGTLQITNKDGVYARTEGAAFKTPTVNLGTEGEDVSIRAAKDVELSNAFTQGVGTIISEEGNVSLKPLSVQTQTAGGSVHGLALYAKGDVKVSNPEGNFNNQNFSQDWAFDGFVFAGDDFILDANPRNDGTTYNVSLRGSVVAKNGVDDQSAPNGIKIKGADKVDLLYEPEYLKFLNRNLQGADGASHDIALEYLYRKF